MDLLITVIGNAVADTEFRERLLRDPLTALDEWGFRLTKGEIEMMQEVLPRASEEELRNKFQALHETLYAKNYCPTKRCSMSAYPPPTRSEEHTSELQSQSNLVCRLLLEKTQHIS